MSGFVVGQAQVIGMTTLVGIICVVAYWLTRNNLVIIASPSTKMSIKVSGMKRDKVLDFINEIEQAKYKRIKQ